jgi:hypothetical protein
MTTYALKNARNNPVGAHIGASPDGNLTRLHYNLTANASGIVTNSTKTTAIAATDVIQLGVIPAGFELHDAFMIISDPTTAACTADIGFAYVDGVDVTAVPQDANYFFDDSATSSAARTRCTLTNAPVRLPKDAYLTYLNNTAAFDAACVIDIYIDGIYDGPA